MHNILKLMVFCDVERARLEIDRQLKELGLDPQLTTQLPHNYRYPKN